MTHRSGAWLLGLLAVACSSAADVGLGEQEAVDENEPRDQAPAWSAGGSDDTGDVDDDAPPPPFATSTVLSVVTYNVAGLPLGLSDADPKSAAPLVGRKLDGYDVAFLQEDFGFHEEIASATALPHQSTPMEASVSADSLGDGLNQFSRFPFGSFARVGWKTCNGVFDAKNDCLTPKGFTVSRLELPNGCTVDVYNAHMDAGSDVGDVEARTEQVGQLSSYINEFSVGHAVVLAGDTNLKKRPGDEEALVSLMTSAGLSDACRQVSCAEPALHDRVLFRSSASCEVSVQAWSIAEEFVYDDGAPLSDHDAVSVLLAVEAQADGS